MRKRSVITYFFRRASGFNAHSVLFALQSLEQKYAVFSLKDLSVSKSHVNCGRKKSADLFTMGMQQLESAGVVQ